MCGVLACPKEGRSLQLLPRIVRAPLPLEPHVCVAVFEIFFLRGCWQGFVVVVSRTVSRPRFCCLAHISGVSDLLKKKKLCCILQNVFEL